MRKVWSMMRKAGMCCAINVCVSNISIADSTFFNESFFILSKLLLAISISSYDVNIFVKNKYGRVTAISPKNGDSSFSGANSAGQTGEYQWASQYKSPRYVSVIIRKTHGTNK